MPLVGKSLYTTENTLQTLDMSGYEFTMYWKKKNEIDQHNAKCAAEEMKAKAEAKARYPLHMACSEGDAELLMELLTPDRINQPMDHNGATPIHFACQAGHEACLPALIAGCKYQHGRRRVQPRATTFGMQGGE